jgi:hypothetical protein
VGLLVFFNKKKSGRAGCPSTWIVDGCGYAFYLALFKEKA